jgi:F420-dependent oxidoreductase-like protein
MRIGTAINEPTGPDALTKLRERLQSAADDGLASAWMSNIFGMDALTALAVAGSQVPGIELGTAVVPTYPRHPGVLAQQALTASLAVGGRLTLGIGLSHEIVIKHMYGLDFTRPARHMSEYLSVLLPLLNGEPADFTGETLEGHLGLTVPGTVPVLLAALAPRMLELAGSRTAGTITWMTGPATIRDHIVPRITAAAAGRPAPRIVCMLPVCVTSDTASARARAAEIFAVYGQLPSYRAMLDREGVTGPEGVAIVGTEEEVSARIQDLAAAGVTDFAAGEYGTDSEAKRTRDLLVSLVTES